MRFRLAKIFSTISTLHSKIPKMPAATEYSFEPTTTPLESESHQFIQRVAHLPMVALTLSRLAELYEQTKLRHEILSYALNKGEATVLGSLEVAHGIANRTGLQGPLSMVDTSACYVLSKVEEKLPIITYTPYEIKTSTRRLYDDNVQPRLDQLTQIKENTVQKYNDAKDYGSNKLSEAKTFGASTVKTMVDVPVHRVNQTVEWSLNAADSLVDKLLPEGEADRLVSSDANSGNLDHAKVLSNKLRQRLYARIAENVQTAQLLAQAFQMVDSLKHSSAGHSVQHVLEEIRRLSGAVHIGELKDALEGSAEHLTGYLPDHLNERLHQASDAAKDAFHQVREAKNLDDLSHTLVGQVNGAVNNVQATLFSILDLLTETYLLKWLIPEYSNIGSLDIHMHG
ncbi:hypothetical protein BV898_07161 [Hypsibius exemplaris]|uniref:Lipid storage droplets surface-binding protein 1 n=1 Tax=Hypsibius exemplaris TaxID=2072580 RepID=A0A1W0WU50_HYPEX|nr:hypothetical protein BV898_07161 [Hypsibius exemplaris]